MLYHDLEPIVEPKRVRDLTGQAFGRLTVLSLAGKRGNYQTHWLCRCECGDLCHVYSGCLVRGTTQSCGCLWRELNGQQFATHGKSRTRVYTAWLAMRQRCYYEKHAQYADYGGRGIKVCDRWRDNFENFYADMGEPPKGSTLDRRENDGPYSPDNCRWATRIEQANNTSASRFIEHAGQRKTVMEWSRETGIPGNTLYYRIYRGWPINRLFDAPGTRLEDHKKAP